MNAHDRLERQLRESIAGTAGRRRAMWARLRLWSRGLPLVIVVPGVTAAVAAAAVSVALTRPPDPGPIPPDTADGVVANAYNVAAAKDRNCRYTVTDSTTAATPSREMLATVPLFRSPATKADARMIRRLETPVGKLTLLQQGVVYIRYLRQARIADGFTFYLMPTSKLGRRRLTPAAANRCDQLATKSLEAQLVHVPKSERARTKRYGIANFSSWRYNLETSHLYDGVLIEAQLAQGGGGDVGALSAISKTGLLGITDSVWYGVVPPGVASVTLHFTSGSGPKRHVLNLSGNVVNSTFAMNDPDRRESIWPRTAIWRSASGHVIKTINEEQFHP